MASGSYCRLHLFHHCCTLGGWLVNDLNHHAYDIYCILSNATRRSRLPNSQSYYFLTTQHHSWILRLQACFEFRLHLALSYENWLDHHCHACGHVGQLYFRLSYLLDLSVNYVLACHWEFKKAIKTTLDFIYYLHEWRYRLLFPS